MLKEVVLLYLHTRDIAVEGPGVDDMMATLPVFPPVSQPRTLLNQTKGHPNKLRN